MKKVLALVLAMVMVLSLAACGGSTTSTTETKGAATETQAAAETQAQEAESAAPEVAAGIPLDGTWPAEKVLIGVETFDVTDVGFLALQEYYEAMTQYFNIEFMYSENIATAEQELQFIENCHAAGCQAFIAYYNITETEAVRLCTELGMYFVGCAEKDSVYEEFKNNEYYLGGNDSGDVDFESGYAMAKTLLEQGAEKFVYASGGDEFGVQMFIDRAAGFNKAIEEAKAENPNVEVVQKVAGWPGTDSFMAAQTAVCDMEFDALVSSFAAAMWFQPLSNVGKLENIKMATISAVDETYYDFAQAGIVSCVVYECPEVCFGAYLPQILNAVSGNGSVMRNADGTSAKYNCPRWTVTTGDQYASIYDYRSAGNFFVTAEDIASCLVAANPDATVDTIAALYGGLDVDAAMAKIQ